MSDSANARLQALWHNHLPDLKQALTQAFGTHAIENRGILTSPRQGKQIASQISELALAFITEEAGTNDVLTTAVSLAEKGMSISNGGAMMRVLSDIGWLPPAAHRRLNQFQLTFMEKLADGRERVHQQTQERAQQALQQALHQQLNQQRQLHHAQEVRNHNLNQILQLNATLAPITAEGELLARAVSGICRALDLADVTIYEWRSDLQKWTIRETTAADSHPGDQIPTDTITLLNGTRTSADGETVTRYPAEQRKESVSIALMLNLGADRTAAMVANSRTLDHYSYQDFPFLIRTFAQSLAALWRNLLLFDETSQRARELEILHGRYMDDIWRTETAVSHTYHHTSGHDDRQPETKETSSPGIEDRLTLHVGRQLIGHVHLPGDDLTPEQKSFAASLVREMGNALNNARLLQTSRAYANQLSLAAEVSRAATTILDRDQLIREVVELIRARFDYYYVGLFLVDDAGETAVLQAGTGEAGDIQVRQGHRLTIGGQSMIGAAIATGNAIVEQDVAHAEYFHRNPLLPDTRAELALPLRTRGHVVGALTVQSNTTGTFRRDSIDVLQSLADQLAVAIINANLFARLQTNLEETDRLYQASRQINTANDPLDVFQALVAFARDSGIVDNAQVIAHDPTAPDYFMVPAFWGETITSYNPDDRYHREKFLFGEHLAGNELILIKDGQNDPKLDRFTRRIFRENNFHAAALIPIHLEGEWLATLALLRTKTSPFRPDELQPFNTLVDQSAVILANQQLLKQTETLYRISRSLSQALTRDDALEIAVREVGQYTGVAQCRFVLYDASTKMGRIEATYVRAGATPDATFPMKGDLVYTQLSQQRDPLLLVDGDPEIPEGCLQRHLGQFGAKQSLLIPATSQQDLIGFLALDSHMEKRPFNPHNVIFAQTVVDHMTTQIENLKLLEEALLRAQELITLNQIQSNLSGILDLNQLVQGVYEQIGRLLHNAIFMLAFYEEDSDTFTPTYTVINNETIDLPPRTLSPNDPLYQFLHRQKPLLATADHALVRELKLPRLEKKPQSSLWVPLRQEDQPVGLISLQAYEPHGYNETDMQLLRSIATHTSLAIANAQLFAKIQASNVKLRQLDHLKTQFLANMSHELRTPLNSIIGFSRVILKGIDGPLTTAQEEDLQAIYHNGQHLLTLINEILDMAKIEAGKMSLAFEPLDLNQLAQQVLKTIRSLIDESKVELDADIEAELPPIEADPVRVRQILTNLLSNAAKFTTTGHIQLQIRRQRESVHIAVADTGIGIDTADYEKIFQAFEQVDTTTTRTAGGTGLGLPITLWLVRAHNGRIWFDSEVGQGTTFHILLPLTQPDGGGAEFPLSASLLTLSEKNVSQR